MDQLIPYLIVCPLIFLGGFVDSIAGGGGLISLPAYLIAGLPAHAAIGTNKISSAMGTSLTTWKFWKQGYIKPRLSLLCVVFALIGSTLGANLALLVSDRYFKIILLVILPLTAFYVFKSKAMETGGKEPLSPGRTALIAAAAAFVIGAYDGFYGPGTGTFLLLILTGLAHMDLNSAAGTTKVINLSTGLAALVTYLLNGQVELLLGFVAGIFGIAGNWLGTKCFTRNGAKIVKPIIFVVLGIFFARIIWDMITGA